MSLLHCLAAPLSSSGASDVIERRILHRARFVCVDVPGPPYHEMLTAGLMLDMKIKCERWGGEIEEDMRETDETTQRGDDETGCEKWLMAGERRRLLAAPVQNGPPVKLRPTAMLVISTKQAFCCVIHHAPLRAPTGWV